MKNENPFNGLGWMDSFVLMVFIDLSLEADNEMVSERIQALINESRKLLAERSHDADKLFQEWKDQEENYVPD